MGGACRPATDARAACEGAQIVILATSSHTPVLDPAWIDPGAYVTTLGPKQQGRAEFGLDLAEAASLLVTDSLDQIGAYDPRTCWSARLGSTGSCRWGRCGLVRCRGGPGWHLAVLLRRPRRH